MKSLEEQLEDYKKMNQAKNAYLAGIIRGWASQIDYAELTHNTKEMVTVIDSMREFSDRIANSAGVIIHNAD